MAQPPTMRRSEGIHGPAGSVRVACRRPCARPRCRIPTPGQGIDDDNCLEQGSNWVRERCALGVVASGGLVAALGCRGCVVQRETPGMEFGEP